MNSEAVLALGARAETAGTFQLSDKDQEDENSLIHLLGNNPKLLPQVHFILQYMRQHAPELERAFARSLRARLINEPGGFTAVESSSANTQASRQDTTASLAASRLEIQIEYQKSTAPAVESGGKTTLSETVESARVTFAFTTVSTGAKQAGPLVLDLDGNGIHATGLAEGRQFDMNADGQLDLTNFIRGGDGLLAMDRNHNGKIDKGSELFGDQLGARNGFEQLRQLDGNRDGIMDKSDEGFTQLSLLVPSKTELDQLQKTSLAAEGVAALKLDYQEKNNPLDPGAVIAQQGSLLRQDGSTGAAVNLLLAYRRIQE